MMVDGVSHFVASRIHRQMLEQTNGGGINIRLVGRS